MSAVVLRLSAPYLAVVSARAKAAPPVPLVTLSFVPNEEASHPCQTYAANVEVATVSQMSAQMSAQPDVAVGRFLPEVLVASHVEGSEWLNYDARHSPSVLQERPVEETVGGLRCLLHAGS